MNGEQLKRVLGCIDNEGFEYCFIGHSDFHEIEDPEFHRLRLAYCEAHERLREYLGIDEWA